jgi:molybdate transport system substrate-binding protein
VLRRPVRPLDRLVPVVGALLAATGLFIGCGAGDGGDELTVLAAASLTEPLTELADMFEEAEGVEVTLSFAASSEVVSQVLDGAPADVVALADDVTTGRLVDGGGVHGDPVTFATNRLEIVVEAGNPLGIRTLADLADPSVVFVTTSPEVPIGRYTGQVLDAAGVEVAPASLEASARGVLTKVSLGEADAGIVYRTDVLAAGDSATGVEIPDELNVEARLFAAVAAESGDPGRARRFVDLLLSEQGRDVLARHGFGSP